AQGRSRQLGLLVLGLLSGIVFGIFLVLFFCEVLLSGQEQLLVFVDDLLLFALVKVENLCLLGGLAIKDEQSFDVGILGRLVWILLFGEAPPALGTQKQVQRHLCLGMVAQEKIG